MKNRFLMKRKGTSEIAILAIFISMAIAALIITNVFQQSPILPYSNVSGELKRFGSDDTFFNALKNSQQLYGRGYGILEKATTAMGMATGAEANVEYSTTNIQVEGVDEADIVKTDGEYIYTISNNQLTIAKAYPADKAEIISTSILTSQNENFYPQELFIDKNRLLIFGSVSYEVLRYTEASQNQQTASIGIMPHASPFSVLS